MFIKNTGHPSLVNDLNVQGNAHNQGIDMSSLYAYKGDEVVGYVPRYI